MQPKGAQDLMWNLIIPALYTGYDPMSLTSVLHGAPQSAPIAGIITRRRRQWMPGIGLLMVFVTITINYPRPAAHVSIYIPARLTI